MPKGDKKPKSKSGSGKAGADHGGADGGTQSWEAAVRDTVISDASWSCRLFMVAAADSQYYDLLDRVCTAVFTGCRRTFVLIDYQDIAEMLLSKKVDGPSQKGGARSGARSRGAPQVGDPVEELYGRAGAVLNETGTLPAPLLAAVIKMELAALRKQKTTVIEIELPGTSSNKKKASTFDLSDVNFSSGGESKDSSSNQKRTEPKVDVKQTDTGKEPKQNERKESRRTSGEKSEGRGRRKTVKEVKLEDELMQDRQEDDNFCKKRLTKLKKRGENDDSVIILDDIVIKEDEPMNGPDIYVILTGFLLPDLPLEMEKRGVPIEVLFRIFTKPSMPALTLPAKNGDPAGENSASLDKSKQSAQSIQLSESQLKMDQSNAEFILSLQIPLFWEQLEANVKSNSAEIIPPNFLVRDLVVPLLTIKCSTEQRVVGELLFDMLAAEIYDHLKLRAIFDCYLKYLQVTRVPDISSVFPPEELCPPEEVEDEAAATEDGVPERTPGPAPATPPALLYQQRLQAVPPEAASVPMIVNALVDQVALWIDGDFYEPLDSPETEETGAGSIGFGSSPVSQPSMRPTPEPIFEHSERRLPGDSSGTAQQSSRASVTIQEPERSDTPPPASRERRGSLKLPAPGQQGRRGSTKSPEFEALRQRRASAFPALGPWAALAGAGRRPSAPGHWTSSRALSLPLPQLLAPPLAGAGAPGAPLAPAESSDTMEDDDVEVPGPWLRRRFAVTQPITEPAPVLVYHCDRVNAQFYSRTDRTVIHQLDHVLRHNFQLLQLQASDVPPDGSFLKHHAAKQELLAKLTSVVTSHENMDYLLRLLMFEALYPSLRSESASPLLRRYRHPSLPAAHVSAELELLQPECGHGAACDELRQLTTDQETTGVRARFTDHCWVELLDPFSMAQTLYEAECGCDLLAASHFEGDDGLYLVYGHPRAYDGFVERRWCFRQHTVVGLRDFIEHSCHMPVVAQWFQQETDRMKKAEKRDREEAERRRELERLRPIPKPPKMKQEVPAEEFIIAQSLKGQKQAALSKVEEADETSETKTEKTQENQQPKKKTDDVKKKPAENRGRKQSHVPEVTKIQLISKEKREKQLASSRARLLDPLPPDDRFRGFDLGGKLAHVSGRQYRQYFDNGSYLTVETSEHLRGSRFLSVSVNHGGTALHVHPRPQGEDVVIHLLGGCVMHLLTRLLMPEPPPTKVASRPPTPSLTPLAPTRRGSPTVRSRKSPSPAGKDKKDNKKEKEGKKKLQNKKSRASTSRSPAGPIPAVEEPEPDAQPPKVSEPQVLHTLRVSCPSGLVVELEPDPRGSGPEPRVLVRQFYLDGGGSRRGVRIFVSEGLLCRLDDGEREGADLLGPDGSITRCQFVQETSSPRPPTIGGKSDRPSSSSDSASSTGAGTAATYRLVPVSLVKANGDRQELTSTSTSSESTEAPRRYLTKLATDPVTREMYVVRQDGVSAVLRPGGTSAIQHADGTRLTLSVPEPEPVAHSDQVPVCSDYIVNDAGWIVSDRASWVLGMRVLISDAATNDWNVQTEHPDYCRVVMRQLAGVCEVYLPQGAVIEARSCGSYTIRQTDDTRLQVDPEAVVFSAPPNAPGAHPTVHTIPLSRPPAPPPPPAPPSAEEASANAAPGTSSSKVADKHKHSKTKNKAEPSAPAQAGPETEADTSPDAEKEPEKPRISDTVCETVDSRRRVFRATRRGRLVKVDNRDTCPANGLTLEMRAQLECNTVLPKPPRLFVLYRDGDGLELVTSGEVSRYLSFVKSSEGGQVWTDAHATDPEVRTVRVFRPVPATEMPQHRWKVPYVERTLIPVNLRNRDLTLMCKDKEAMVGSRTWWGGGDGKMGTNPVTGRPHKVELIESRELLQMPRVQPEMYRTVVQAVHQTRLRGERGEPTERPVVIGHQRPPPKRSIHLFEANKLIEWLEAARANHKLATSTTPKPPKQSPEFWENFRSEAAEINTYREMLRTQKFPAYFQSEAGGEFLGKLRQTSRPPLAPRLRRGVSQRQVVLGGVPRPLPSGAVTCRPAVLDLGAVRRGESAAGRLCLHNGGAVTVEFRLRPPAPLLSLHVEPRSGVLEAGGELPLLVTFQPGDTMTGRSVYFRLDVVLEGGLDVLQVPVVACVSGGDCLLSRLPPFSVSARANSVH
ncbi:uncharacterized protein LOC122390394 [Amphibalanus amphitrite]|uniref:uncharacterized protein LOC122390394 n=1 Tax=Amphibalanus amphitrite TaxID=1232801 RepID=UPI001C904EC7|nr:uncharacterized protein LOC122390394 [Amphibalanus amphitrite]